MGYTILPDVVLRRNTVEAAYYDHLGLALFDNNNRLITLSGGYKNLYYLTKFIVTVQSFTCIKTTKFILKKTYVVLPVVCLQLVVPE
jgi:hypothetical protein